jgi:hypothetical protein
MALTLEEVAMKRPVLQPLLGATLVLFVAGTLAAQAQQVGANSLPWMKLHDVHTTAAGPALVRFLDQDLFLARDGTLISLTVAADLVNGGGFTSTEIAGTASPEALAVLGAVLFESHIGRLGGSCTTELMPLGSAFSIGISWFGSGSRTSHFTITNEGSLARTCSPQQVAVLHALQALQASVIADPLSSITSSPCARDAQCPDGLVCCAPCGIPIPCPRSCFRPDPTTGKCPLFP